MVIGILLVVLALFGAGFAALRSDAARNRIESTLSTNLGHSVRLGQTTVKGSAEAGPQRAML